MVLMLPVEIKLKRRVHRKLTKLVVVCYLSYVSKLLKWRCFQAINYGWEKKLLTREMRRIFDSTFKFNIIKSIG